MIARLACASDFSSLLELQAVNLVTNLNEEQKKEGFVTTPFSEAQLQNLVDRKGLFVIDVDGKVGAYAAAAGWASFAGRPMFDLMLERFCQISFRGIPITATNSYQYGPVCVKQSLRGTGAFALLFQTVKTTLALQYSVGTTFINQVNQRSFNAHKRQGLEVIDSFSFQGQQYWGLAFL